MTYFYSIIQLRIFIISSLIWVCTPCLFSDFGVKLWVIILFDIYTSASECIIIWGTSCFSIFVVHEAFSYVPYCMFWFCCISCSLYDCSATFTYHLDHTSIIPDNAELLRSMFAIYIATIFPLKIFIKIPWKLSTLRRPMCNSVRLSTSYGNVSIHNYVLALNMYDRVLFLCDILYLSGSSNDRTVPFKDQKVHIYWKSD